MRWLPRRKESQIDASEERGERPSVSHLSPRSRRSNFPYGASVTRRPYPLGEEIRHHVVALGYAVVGRALRPLFRRPTRIEELRAARILILKPCCLGDVVFSTALIRELRRNLPHAYLAYAVGAHSRAALASAPLDAIVDLGASNARTRPSSLLDLVRRIRAGRYDACFVLERSAPLALAPLLAGIPIRIGIDSGGRGFSLTAAVSPRPIRAESELYLDLLRAIGGKVTSGALAYQPSIDARARVDALLRERGIDGPFVAIHAAGGVNPGMTLLRKRWPPEHFADLARHVLASGASVVLVGAPEDAATARKVERLSRADPGRREGAGGEEDEPVDQPSIISPSVIELCGQLTLDELAALAVRAGAYVGNDSGPTHLAEAAGANVVMLFGPSDPLLYGPRGRNAVALGAGFWCSPCFEDGRVAPCARVRCMEAIPAERVWREVARFLEAGT